MNAVNAATVDEALFDPARLARADTLVREQPFRFLVAHDQLPESAAQALNEDFPKYAGAGFFPYEARDCGPSVNRLIADLTRDRKSVV